MKAKVESAAGGEKGRGEGLGLQIDDRCGFGAREVCPAAEHVPRKPPGFHTPQ